VHCNKYVVWFQVAPGKWSINRWSILVTCLRWRVEWPALSESAYLVSLYRVWIVCTQFYLAQFPLSMCLCGLNCVSTQGLSHFRPLPSQGTILTWWHLSPRITRDFFGGALGTCPTCFCINASNAASVSRSGATARSSVTDFCCKSRPQAVALNVTFFYYLLGADNKRNKFHGNASDQQQNRLRKNFY